jgi:hypothetical protein
MLMSLLLALGLAGQGAPAASPEAATTRTSKSNAALVKEAREAYDRGEKPAFLSIYEELARRRPGEVFTLYNLACGQSLNGQSEAAVRTLEDILAHRVAPDLDADTDFEPIRRTEGYKRVMAGMSALRKERISSGAARAFTIPEKGFVAEGVAYDPVTKAASPAYSGARCRTTCSSARSRWKAASGAASPGRITARSSPFRSAT